MLDNVFLQLLYSVAPACMQVHYIGYSLYVRYCILLLLTPVLLSFESASFF